MTPSTARGEQCEQAGWARAKGAIFQHGLCRRFPSPPRAGGLPGSSPCPQGCAGSEGSSWKGKDWAGLTRYLISPQATLRIRPWPRAPAAGSAARQDCLSPGLSTPAAFWCLINDRRKYKINKKRFCPLMRCMQEGSGQNSRKWGLWRIAAARDLIYSWYTPALAATIRKRFYEWEYLYKRECNMEGR